MAGYLPTRPPAVPVVLPSLLSMHCHVQKVAFLPSGTMRSETILPISCQKSVTMFQLHEPHLQPITGEVPTSATANFQDGARLDVAADGFWGSRFESAFFDVKVFNPYAPSNRRPQPSACYRTHEASKKRAYERRIREVEHASFTPLIFSATGGLGREAQWFTNALLPALSKVGPLL